MRNNVTFRYPEEFKAISDAEGILSVEGATWFLPLLQMVPGIQVEADLCQEDWGVVIFANRNKKRFWIGMSMCPASDYSWLVHVHHNSFAWLQRLSRSGTEELNRLIEDLNRVLASDPKVSDIEWYREEDMKRGTPEGSRSPNEA